MHRQSGTLNIPQTGKDEMIRKHEEGMSTRELAWEYGKTFRTIKGLSYREKRKKREFNVPKQRGRKPAGPVRRQVRKRTVENESI